MIGDRYRREVVMVQRQDGAVPGVLPAQATAGSWHLSLLRQAGVFADELVCAARHWLADGEHLQVARALGFAAVTGRIPLPAEDIDLIQAELTVAGQNQEVLGELRRTQVGSFRSGALAWAFTPMPVQDAGEASGVPFVLDLTGHPDDVGVDRIDRAAVDLAANEPDLAALWRAWRYPGAGSAWPAPRRIFVACARDDVHPDALPAVTGRLQHGLNQVGELNPQIEVCPSDQPMPVYQDSARTRSALLWAREPRIGLELARVFDAADPQNGPRFTDDHPRILDSGEREQLGRYLDCGTPVLTSSTTMADILAPEGPPVVPVTFRTDGRWIWTDAVTYYLQKHAMAPDDKLLNYLRTVPPSPPRVSWVALHRVTALLQRPVDDDASWVVPQVAPSLDQASLD